MSAKAAVAPEDWIPKAAAAKILGVSLRMVERREQAGYLEKKQLPRLPTESTARVVYSRADVVALKAGKPNTHARAIAEDAEPEYTPGDVVGAAARPPAVALAVRPNARDPFAGLAAQLAGLATFAAQYAKPDPAPWLTLDEAAAYSGLTRAWLLKEAEAGQSACATRDMGKHARGGRWRFLRADLGRAE